MVDYDMFIYVTYATNFIGELHNKENIYVILTAEPPITKTTYKAHATTKENGKLISGKIGCLSGLKTIYTTNTASVKTNVYSDKTLGAVSSTKALTKYNKYHPVNLRSDYVNFEITVDKADKFFEMLVIETGGK
jgi:hypothetical protein